MKEIPLSQGKFTRVDDEDFEFLCQWDWYAHTRNGVTYASRTRAKSDGPGPSRVYMHRMILPGARRVDHEDTDGLNNTRRNLRPATRSQNSMNWRKRTGTSSRFKGVDRDPRSCEEKWRAYIGHEGRKKSLGVFRVEEDAARAYDTAARASFGEFARLNFPN